MIEEWRPVVGYEGIYEVSDQGRVRRLHHCRGVPPWRILSLQCDRQGYLSAYLYRRGEKRRIVLVHRLVAESFIGACPGGLEVNHKNGQKGDNRPVNLEYVTHHENVRHAVEAGLVMRGERVNTAKLTEETVRALRERYRRGVRGCGAVALAREFGVGKSTVACVVTGQSWTSSYAAHPDVIDHQRASGGRR